MPIGACLTAGAAATLFHPGNHGSTFGGNPLACRAALETLRIIEEESLMKNATEIGALINQNLSKKFAGNAGVKEIRNAGLMIAIELAYPCGDLVKEALAAGLLINVTADNVVRLLPPLNFSHEQVGLLSDILAPLILGFLKRQTAPQPTPAAA